MGASSPPELGQRVAEPFRSDPDFWRSVCASADAVVLLAVAVVGAAALRLGGAGTVLVWLPFALPVIFLVRAAVSGSRFRRGHEPLPAVVDTVLGEQSWRDAERTAVAAAFGRALVRGRHLVA
ncbi:MAG: hypothetical protein ACHQE5_04130 [Actinomycetes bacterium]